MCSHRLYPILHSHLLGWVIRGREESGDLRLWLCCAVRGTCEGGALGMGWMAESDSEVPIVLAEVLTMCPDTEPT